MRVGITEEIPTRFFYGVFLSMVFSYFCESFVWQLQQEAQEEQECASSLFCFFVVQLQASGHPIHFFPLFFAFIIYAAAAPMIMAITAIAIISVSVILLPQSNVNCFFLFLFC